MLLMFYLIMLILFILMMMLLINMIMAKKMYKNREKMSPFECGFDPMSMNRLPFSLSFYLISIIFLIFDVEIAMILPMIYLMNYYYYILYMNIMFIIMILLIGLYMEWNEGALKWFK